MRDQKSADTQAPVIEAIDSLGKDWQKFKSDQIAERRCLTERVDQLEAGLQGHVPSGSFGAGGSASSPEIKAFAHALRTGEGLQRKALDSTSASGALVPQLIASEILSVALGLSRVGKLVRRTRTETGDYKRVVRVGPPSAEWVSETGTRNAATDAAYRTITPGAGELSCYASYSNWLLDDSQFNIAAELMREVQDRFAKSIEAAIVSGSGTNQPTGLLNATPTSAVDDASPQRAAGALQYIATGVSGSLGHQPNSSPIRYGDDRLLEALFSLRPEYRSNATWLMASATLAQVRRFKTADGAPIWTPTMGDAQDQGDGMLLGRPVVCCESMPAIGANAHPILIGDLARAYELVEIHGMSITRDEVTTPGRTKFYVRCRIGGAVIDNFAAKVLKCAAS